MGKQVEFGIRVSLNGNKQAVDGIDQITQANKRSGVTAQESAEKATAAQQKLEREQQRFIESLAKKADAVGKTTSQLALMRAQELGVADSANHLISKLAATEVGVNRVGMSSNAMSAALRNVPAQFTDIVVSLQAGQSPMQVFLQQGGQLKDMFGGMGGAARALGSYVVGLVTPFTVAAAAVGVLTLAYYQGSQELTNYQRAIILTNNITGVSASRVADMANNINSAGDISKGAAAEALAAILNTGSVAADNLERFAAVAAKMQKTVGISVGETAKDLSELAKSPLEASKKLSEQYNFLDKKIYDQIKALQEQGRTAEAAAIAQKAYIDSFDKKSKEIKDNLGYVESGWNSVKNAAIGAWDAILNVGREDTNVDKLTRVKTQLQNMQFNRDQKQQSGDTSSKIYKNILLQISALEMQAKTIQTVIDKDNGLAEAKGKVTQENNKSIASAEKLSAYLNSGSRQTKAQALTEEAKRFAEATAGFSKTSKEYQSAEAANALAVKDINERFKEKNTEFKKQENAYQTLITSIKEKLAVSQAELLQNTNLTEGQKLRIKFDNDLREGKITATTAEREFARSLTSQIDLNAILATAEKDQLARSQALKDEFLARFNANTKMLEANDAYIESLSASNEQAQLEVTLLGKTEQERKIAIEQFKVELALRKQIKEIEKSKGFDDDKKKAIQNATNAANARKEQIIVEVNTEEILKARKELDAFLDPAKAQSFGEALAGAFGTAGNALQKLSTNLQEYGRTEAEIAKARANAELGRASNPIKYAQDIAAINERSARAQINNYANIAGAAKNFFSEGTRGYKALEAAENAFRVVQLASDLAKGMSAAAVGIASQAQGDPYTALPRMAAMAAVMASLGFATGFFGSGGSGGGKSAEQMQKEQGTGSVFGDLTAKSESITKSIEEMSRTSNRLLPVNEGMLVALKNIESSMAGFTNLVVRDQGVINGGSFGIQTGQLNIGKPTDGISSAMTKITEALLPGIGGKVASFLNNLWGKTTQNIVDSGVSFGGKLADLQAGKGFGQYASVDTTSSSWFGLKKSTSNSVQSQALSSELSSQLGLIFSNMSVALKEANKALGGSAAEIENTLADLTLSSTKVSLKGLTGQALTEALNGVISKSLDEMAQAAFPAYDKFREVGEGYAQTVLRVANNFASVNQIFDEIGLKLFAVGQQGVEASLGLTKMLGGLENLQSLSSSYLQNFFTEEERAAKTISSITEALAKVNVAMPTSREAYRAALEKAQAENQIEVVSTLLKLNEAFASVVKETSSSMSDVTAQAAQELKLAEQREAVDRKVAVSARRAAEAIEQQSKATEELAKKTAQKNYDDNLVSRLRSGDVQSIMSGFLEANPINFGSYMQAGNFNAGAFNAELIRQRVKLSIELANKASADAINVEDVTSVFDNLMSFVRDSDFKYQIRSSVISGVGLPLQGAVTDALYDLINTSVDGAIRSQFTPNSSGIASVFAANADYTSALMRDGEFEYSQAITGLNFQLKNGKINIDEFNQGVAVADRLFESFGKQIEKTNQLQEALVTAGRDSINFYFAQISKAVQQIGVEAEKAETPLSQVTTSLGRMKSIADVFNISATAAGETNGNAQLVSETAATIAKMLTTESASALAQEIAKKESFSGSDSAAQHDFSLLIEGVREFDAKSFEVGFLKITDALNAGRIDQAQYKDLFSMAMDTYKPDVAARELVSSFSTLREAAESLSRSLKLDDKLSTLSPSQMIAEASNEYYDTLSKALAGDPKAVSQYEAVAKQYAEILYENAATYEEYKNGFESVITNNALTMGVNDADRTQEAMLSELRALRQEIEDLRAAQESTAVSSDRTVAALQQIIEDGIPVQT